ncbi:MAG: hypothetical protein ACK5OX_19915 [Desertimonas sp.]
MLLPVSTPVPTAPPAGSRGSAASLQPDGGKITPLRRADAVAPGGLAQRRPVSDRDLITAHDLTGTAWWIAAAAVWLDAAGDQPGGESDHDRRRPRATGLATARTTTAAMLAGLSDRLGWEAVEALSAGSDLPPLTAGHLTDAEGVDERDVTVLDGRIGHDVPTVVVLGDDVTRWGAGRTWTTALHRALFGCDRAGADDPLELAWIADRLRDAGLTPASVDIGSANLRRHGVVRTSVQLLLR